MNDIVTVEVKVPFNSDRIARIVFDVLRVDEEPKRSGIRKKLTVENNILTGIFTGTFVKHIRVAVNNYFDNINLVLKTIDTFGPPVSEHYDFYD